MWRYAEDSAAYLFGGAELDPVAQTIIQALGRGPQSSERDPRPLRSASAGGAPD